VSCACTRVFFQANRFLLEPLARGVLELVPPGDSRILDLYAGVGLFALPLAARDGCETLAVEQSRFAAEDARVSAERAGLSRVSVRAAEVEQSLRELPAREGERIVLDQPRTGAGRGVVEALGRGVRVIIYVACGPPTLARPALLPQISTGRHFPVRRFETFHGDGRAAGAIGK
jgi:23S rRNA (uracil1939-C5)-methyltransferase